MINRAVKLSADLIVFPELSITGYEPILASELANNIQDVRFNVFQEIAIQKNSDWSWDAN